MPIVFQSPHLEGSDIMYQWGDGIVYHCRDDRRQLVGSSVMPVSGPCKGD